DARREDPRGRGRLPALRRRQPRSEPLRPRRRDRPRAQAAPHAPVVRDRHAPLPRRAARPPRALLRVQGADRAHRRDVVRRGRERVLLRAQLLPARAQGAAHRLHAAGVIVADRSRWVLPELLRERAQELGDRPFLSFAVDEASATYAEADERSDRLAAGLAALGVKRGDRVLAMTGNRIEFVLTWFALNKLGAFHAPVNTDYRGEFLEHVANTAQARLMVVETRHVPTVVASRERLPF